MCLREQFEYIEGEKCYSKRLPPTWEYVDWLERKISALREAQNTPSNKQSAKYLCECASSNIWKSVNGNSFRCSSCGRLWRV